MTHNLAELLRLVAVTDDRILAGRDLVASCVAAARGGATSIQLRCKLVGPREVAALARAILAATPVALFLNDRLDVALAVGAVGVHLGPDDLPLELARRVAPPGFLLGASVGAVGEAGAGAPADYWGIGPLRRTTTKPDAGDPLGVPGFAEVVRVSGGRPCVAIGGVEPGDVAAVRQAGGVGVAVISGIFSGDPEVGARRYAAAFEAGPAPQS